MAQPAQQSDRIKALKAEVEEEKAAIQAAVDELEEFKIRPEPMGFIKGTEAWQKQLTALQEDITVQRSTWADSRRALNEGMAAGSEQEEGASAKRKRGLTAGTAVSNFWELLPQAILDNKVLQLADGTHFLGDESLGSSLYLRDCYMGMEALMARVFSDGCYGMAIIGNAGIGKSMFGYLLLYRWAKEGCTVVLRKAGFDLMLFSEEGAFILEDAAAFRAAMNTPNVRYLVDGVNPMKSPLPPTIRGAQAVLLTSIRREVYKEFVNRNKYKRYKMDIWSLEELEECLKIYPAVTRLEMQQRYDGWGGIPRYVLERTSPEEQDLLSEAIQSCTAKFVQDSVGESSAHPDVSGRVLHMRVGENFYTTHYTFASPWVAEQVAAKLYSSEKEELRRFIRAAIDEGAAGGYRGQLWEGMCHKFLALGGRFRVRDAGSSDVSWHTIQPCPRRMYFDDWEVAKQQPDGTYCQPHKNNPAVDAAIQPATLLQITVSDRHSINCAGLSKAVGGMKADRDVVLYFVVPPDRFDEFKKPNIGAGVGVNELRKLVHLRILECPI